MKIFLTGGTGFIGSHFINKAHDAGHEVVALRRSPQSKPRTPLKQEPVWVDQPLAEVTLESLKGCDALVHLAAHSANVPYDTFEACILYNVIHPLALFRQATLAGISRFIVAGSCFEYGRSGERYEFIPTDAPLEPTSSYPASKAAASVAFHGFACETKVELLILRIFHVYGEGELESRFWPSLRNAARAGEDFSMSEGTQIRDFINVMDVAESFVSALSRSDLAQGQPFIENLGTGHPQTLADFARAEWKRFNASGKLLAGAMPMRVNEVMRFVPL
jgi:nucleoside-diphosphate-sugar epimerase